MRLGDLDELRKKVTSEYDDFIGIADFIEIEESMPTVDAELVKHGEWVYRKNMGYFCSNCIESGLSPTNADDNCGYSLDGTMKYCWNCGAVMDL